MSDDDDQWAEWATSTANRPGTRCLLRKAGKGERVGGMVRLVVRRGTVPDANAQPQCEPLKVDAVSGVPLAAACVIPGVRPEIREKIIPDAEFRAKPQNMHELFQDAATHQHVLACLTACQEACMQPGTAKRRSGAPPQIWGVIGELLKKAEGASQPVLQLERSTGWDPVALRSARCDDAEDLMARGCRCQDKDYRFVEWVLRGCPLGVIRLRNFMAKTVKGFLALLRHDALFQLLSRARAHPLTSSCILRGYIDEESPDIFRVAGSLQDVPRDEQATFKHHLAFVVQAAALSSGDVSAHMAASALWRIGVLNFILSAPRSAAGKWRIRLGTGSPITGDCLLVVLTWVGNSYFGQEALRRGVAAPPLLRLSGAAEPGVGVGCNVLFGLLTGDTIDEYIKHSGVPLDAEQRGVLADMSISTDPLLCISALAGTGKTALAHCVLKAFMERHRGSTPRQLVLYTVPTRALREDVVLELLKVKAARVSAFFTDVCASCSDALSCQKFVAFQTLPTWKGGL